MKLINILGYTLLASSFIVLFSQCSSAQKLQEQAPFKIGQVYFQKWNTAVQDGGSGINLFIPLEEKELINIGLDSVYFRGKVSKLGAKPNQPLIYIGRFATTINQKQDIIMSSDPIAEYGNQFPKVDPKIPFEIKGNECIVSYIEKGKTKYFKIDKILEKETIAYPSAAPKQ